MIAILGGFGAALLWAASTLASSRSSRLIGASSTLAWMMLVGLVVSLPLVAVSGPVPSITPAMVVWLSASGLGGVIGLQFVYRGLRIGKVGAVAALASTEGAIAAVIAVIGGEHLTILVAFVLCVIAVGVATVALATGEVDAAVEAGGIPVLGDAPELGGSGASQPGPSAERRAAMYGAAAAVCFGFGIYGTAQIGLSLPVIYAVLPARVVGVVAVFVPLAIARRLQLSRRAVPLIVVIGLAEVFGNVAFVLGSRESIAVAAVLGSQFAAVAAVAAFFLFRERLTPRQRSGVVAIALGVALLTAVRG